MKNKLKKIIVGLLVVSFLLQSGCWNRRELETIGVVMIVVIDKDDKTGEFKCYFGVVKPAQLRSQGGETVERAAVMFESRGRTIFEAIRATLTETPRKLFFGQLLTLVITEKVAKEGEIGDVLDMMLRDHEFRRNIKLYITPNTGETAILSRPEFENLLAKEINSIGDQSKSIGMFPDININDFVKVLASDVPNPIAPILIIKEGLQLQKLSEDATEKAPMVPFVEGAVVFKGEKFAGEIDKMTTRGLMFITNKIKSTIVVVPSPGIEQKPISVEVVQSKAKVTPNLDGDLPSIYIEVKVEANIGEQMDDTNFAKEENLKQLEKIVAKEIEKDIQKTIDSAQLDLRVDYFGFGEDVHRKYKEYWKEHKTQWENIFPDINIATDVEVKLRRMGLQTKPLDVK